MATAKTKVSPTVLAKIKKLVAVSRGLDKGEDFNITRLTVLKSLCEDPKIASKFALHLAQLAKERMEAEGNSYLPPKQWALHKSLVKSAVPAMKKYVSRRTKSGRDDLWKILHQLEELQNRYENQRCGPVRLVDSTLTLVVEKALRCMLSDYECSFWAYHTAREYAERYDSRYGTGLIPESAPMMRDIVDFWLDFYSIEL